MPVTSIDKDVQSLTLTVHAEFPVSVARLWDAYLDPRQIEKFWGPVEYPATFTRHDAAAGGYSNYHMTSPEGEQFHGYWHWQEVVDQKFFEVIDGFANNDGSPNAKLPTSRLVFTFDPLPEGTKLTVTGTYDSAADLEQVVAMGMIDGTRSAMSQIEQVLIDLRDYAQNFATEAELLNDTQVRVSRLVRGTRQQVWDAHHDPELVKRWQYGPDGWKMTKCELAPGVGESYLLWWAPDDGGKGFGFSGKILERVEGHYEASTEQLEGGEEMLGSGVPGSVNQLTFTSTTGGTLVTTLVTYRDKAARDAMLATGMADGMEASYARLESIL